MQLGDPPSFKVVDAAEGSARDGVSGIHLTPALGTANDPSHDELFAARRESRQHELDTLLFSRVCKCKCAVTS
jgi:hypothetical protein